MKFLLFMCSFVLSVVSYAQEIEGGLSRVDPFRFKILKYEDHYYPNSPNDADIVAKIDRRNATVNIDCSENQDFDFISYSSSTGEHLVFQFESNAKCLMVIRCTHQLIEGLWIEIQVDRLTRKITKVILPGTCDTDEWASARQSFSQRI